MTTTREFDATTIEELVGFDSGPTDWFEVTQDQVNDFADCTHDHQFIHVDPERAAKSPFGGTIAHGFLTFSMLSYFAGRYSPPVRDVAYLVNYGCDRLRFLMPVRVGKRIRAQSCVVAVDAKADKQYLVRSKVVIEIEGEEKPALSCETLGLVVFA